MSGSLSTSTPIADDAPTRLEDQPEEHDGDFLFGTAGNESDANVGIPGASGETRWSPFGANNAGSAVAQPWSQAEFDSIPTSAKKKRGGRSTRRPIVITAVAALVIGGTAGYFSSSFIGRPNVFDATKVAQGVGKVLQQDFGIQDIDKVSCPTSQPVTADSSFVCTFAVGSQQSSVRVTALNDEGQYLVGEPKE